MSDPAPQRRLPQRIDFVTPSDAAICLHEAGHACVARMMGLLPERIEFIEDTESQGIARARIPDPRNQRARRLIACGAFAVEWNLFTNRRLVDDLGNLLTERTFLQMAIGRRASLDKIKYFGIDRERADGTWPRNDDLEFAGSGRNLASLIPMDYVNELAEKLLNARSLDRKEIEIISAKYLAALDTEE